MEKLCQKLKLKPDYYSTSGLYAINKATKIILLNLLRRNKDPLINWIIHIVFLTYMNLERIKEEMISRLVGYNILEMEFQDMMTKDFTKHQIQIGELEVKINKIQNEIGDMVKTSDMDLKYAEDRLH